MKLGEIGDVRESSSQLKIKELEERIQGIRMLII